MKVELNDNTIRARKVIGYYTVAASATGGVPVPASSVAIVANNGYMMAHIAYILGISISFSTLISSLGIAGTLNIAGRAVFIEVAKLLSWGTGSIWALAALSVVGATTAGVQTYIIGLFTIEIARNGGNPLTAKEADKIIKEGKKTYDMFLKEMENSNLEDPGDPPQEALDGLESKDKLS